MRRLAIYLLAIAAVLLSGCNHIDDKRIPPLPVYIPFATIGDWNLYGVPGAGSYRYFIKEQKLPTSYPYTALAATGFGGVLLIGDIHGNPVAYDLACPVECRSDVRVSVVDDEALVAECPKCHSTYDIITNYGYPLSGPAAEHGYGLQKYYVVNGNNGEYRMVTR